MPSIERRSLKINVSSSIGKVSARYIAPAEAKCIVSLAHGAGAGMNHPFMEALAASLAKFGIATLRFNFPFTENDKKRPDTPAVAQLTIEAALAKANELLPEKAVFHCRKIFWRKNEFSIFVYSPGKQGERNYFLWISIACSGQAFD